VGIAATETISNGTYEKPILRDYVETILICVIFVIFSRAFVFQQSKIPSGSMEDTLLIGDYIMVNRFVYAPYSFEWERALLPLRRIQRGDVVVFKHPPGPEQDFIKRVIGLPGDTIELRGGRLYVNDRWIDEPYVNDVYRIQDADKNFGPIQVRPDDFFVMGDHRDASSDSRKWGPVPRDLMKGRALLIWFSFSDPVEQRQRNPFLSSSERFGSWGRKLRHMLNNCDNTDRQQATPCTRYGRFFDVIR